MDKQKEVGQYLSDNPDFAKSWFLSNVGKRGLEAWLPTNEMSVHMEVLNDAADAFLEEGDELGSSSHFTLSAFNNALKKRGSFQVERFDRSKSLRNSKTMSPQDLFLELVKDIATELDTNILCHKILLNVSTLTKGDKGSLFLARGIGESKVLVSKLFDVSKSTTLEESIHTEETEIIIPFGKGIAGTVAKTKQPINIKDAYQDTRFNKEVDRKTGYHTQSLLCMPIINYEGELIGVAQIMNKTDGSQCFSKQDEETFGTYLSFCGIGLSNAQLFEMSVVEHKRNQLLLQLARNIFEEQTNLDSLVQKIMTDGKEVLQCQQCTIYFIDRSKEKVQETINGLSFSDAPQKFESYYQRINEEPTVFKKHSEAIQAFKKERTEVVPFKSTEEVVFTKVYHLENTDTVQIITPGVDQPKRTKAFEIAQLVAFTGEANNVLDGMPDIVQNDEEVRIQSMLCVPIRNVDQEVIGVAQFINKLQKKTFSANDCNIVEAFSIFCGLGLHNCVMYENVCMLMAKQTVALEVLSYHASASSEETLKLKKAIVPTANEMNLFSFDYDDILLSDDATCQGTLRMFLDIGVISKFHVPYEVLCRFILSVKKNYRPVTYHNWRHGHNVAQTMFAMITTGNMSAFLDDLAQFGLIVACLAHDLDHRGTNNTFQSKAESPLAQLYGTSTMEHHHFDQCVMILSSEGNNIFGGLSSEQYRQVVKLIESAILSTDLALYFKKKGNFQTLVDSGSCDWKTPENNDLLRSMMMTACDVSAITKPWEVQKRVAHMVAGEFFEQGDLERERLKEEPIAMMDRKKQDELPKMQVGFIDFICLPIYKMLAQIEPGLEHLHQGCLTNRAQWQSLADADPKAKAQLAQEKEQKRQEARKKKLFASLHEPSNKNKKKAKNEHKQDTTHQNNGDVHTEKVVRTQSKSCIIL